MVEDKDKILKTLEKQEMATTTIANILKFQFWKTYALLQELEKEGSVIKDKKPSQTFWRIKK